MHILLTWLTACTADTVDTATQDSAPDSATSNEAPPAPVLSWSNSAAVGGLDVLVCQVDEAASADPNGDPLSVSFRWQLDGQDHSPAATQTVHPGDTLPASETSPGEVWTCLAVSNDGQLDSPEASISQTLQQRECDASDPLAVCTSINEGATPLDAYTSDAGWLAFQLSADGDQAIQGVEFYTGEATSLTAIEIWTHDSSSGLPGTPIAGAAFTPTTARGYQGVQYDDAVELADGTPYWIVWKPTQAMLASYTRDDGATRLPTTVSWDEGASWNQPSDAPYMLRVSCCE
ncbi:MAG: DUF4082 domain-containing protein [Myxococcota bacterium]|nr:DUF4082 domain-containing protein [Myxococcota bacterium]